MEKGAFSWVNDELNYRQILVSFLDVEYLPSTIKHVPPSNILHINVVSYANTFIETIKNRDIF